MKKNFKEEVEQKKVDGKLKAEKKYYVDLGNSNYKIISESEEANLLKGIFDKRKAK